MQAEARRFHVPKLGNKKGSMQQELLPRGPGDLSTVAQFPNGWP